MPNRISTSLSRAFPCFSSGHSEYRAQPDLLKTVLDKKVDALKGFDKVDYETKTMSGAFGTMHDSLTHFGLPTSVDDLVHLPSMERYTKHAFRRQADFLNVVRNTRIDSFPLHTHRSGCNAPLSDVHYFRTDEAPAPVKQSERVNRAIDDTRRILGASPGGSLDGAAFEGTLDKPLKDFRAEGAPIYCGSIMKASEGLHQADFGVGRNAQIIVGYSSPGARTALQADVRSFLEKFQDSAATHDISMEP